MVYGSRRMSELEEMEAAYAAANELLEESGLISRPVMQTPSWTIGQAIIASYWEGRGWHGDPMGPSPKDSWWRWIEVVSHTLERGHTLANARCFLEITRMVVDAMKAAEVSTQSDTST